MIKRVLFVITFFAFSLTLPPSAFSADKSEVEKIVKDYIESHPELIDSIYSLTGGA